MGVAGDWHIVESAPTESPTGTGEESTQHGDDIQNPEDNQETNKKRAVPDPAEEERGRWKLRKKTTAVGLGEIYDPGVFAIKLKTKAEVKEEDTSQAKEPSGDANATALPKWAPVKWKKAGEPADDARGEVSLRPEGVCSASARHPLEAARVFGGEGFKDLGVFFSRP